MTSRRSSGSIRAERAVEPTMSENITVTWRRSAAVSLVGAGTVEDISEGVGSGFVPERKPTIASSSLRRSPTAATPKSLRSSAVSFGRTAASTLLSRNTFSYSSRPRLRSHPPTSMMGLPDEGDDDLGQRACPGECCRLFAFGDPYPAVPFDQLGLYCYSAISCGVGR